MAVQHFCSFLMTPLFPFGNCLPLHVHKLNATPAPSLLERRRGRVNFFFFFTISSRIGGSIFGLNLSIRSLLLRHWKGLAWLKNSCHHDDILTTLLLESYCGSYCLYPILPEFICIMICTSFMLIVWASTPTLLFFH